MHPLITIDVELEINVEENASKEIEDGDNLSEQYCMAMHGMLILCIGRGTGGLDPGFEKEGRATPIRKTTPMFGISKASAPSPPN
jgi:hypothetical protein